MGAIQRLLYKPGNYKTHIILEEFPTVYVNAIDRSLAISRSYNVAITMVLQNYDQLKLYYGRSLADVLFNLPGNIICGQAFGHTARLISDRIGKILQQKESTSVNNRDTSTNYSLFLDSVVTQPILAKLSTGEMVGLTADNMEQASEINIFHGKILNETSRSIKAGDTGNGLPQIRNVSPSEIFTHYLKIKEEVRQILADELIRIANSPELAALLISLPA